MTQVAINVSIFGLLFCSVLTQAFFAVNKHYYSPGLKRHSEIDQKKFDTVGASTADLSRRSDSHETVIKQIHEDHAEHRKNADIKNNKHDHHKHDDHGDHHNDGPPTVSITKYGKDLQLYLDFPELVKGKESKFLAHLTILKDHKPVSQAKVFVVLSSAGVLDEKFEVTEALQDGIFTPVVVPSIIAKRQVTLVVESGRFSESFDLGVHEVHSSHENHATDHEEDDHDLIAYTQENQWKTEFRIQQVVPQAYFKSHQFPAKIKYAPNAQYSVKLPHGGWLADLTVKAYQKVRAGDQLGLIEADEDFSRRYFYLEGQSKILKAQLLFNQSEEERYQRLLKNQSASRKELLKSELEVQRVETELATVEMELSRLVSHHELEINNNSLYFILRSFVDGVIQTINANPQQWLAPQEEILSILQTQSKFIEVYLPLSHELSDLSDISYRFFNQEKWNPGKQVFDLDRKHWPEHSANDSSYKVLSIPVTQPERFKSDSNLEVQLTEGESVFGLAVPLSSISVEQGNSYIYVQRDGEHFEAKLVKTGYQTAESVLIEEGLSAGAWIVTKGVYNLRMAASADQVPDHGHAH